MKLNRINRWSASILAALCSVGLLNAGDNAPMNILFIGVDDLRPELGCYGASYMHTPHIDQLAEQGMAFQRAYVQQAVCAASRASLLTGFRPDTTTVDYPYNDYFKEEFLEAHDTIPRFFAKRGYYTRTLGKIHHGPAQGPHRTALQGGRRLLLAGA